MDGNKKIHIWITFLNGTQVTRKRRFSELMTFFSYFFVVLLAAFQFIPSTFGTCLGQVSCPTCSFRVSNQQKVQFQAVSVRFIERNPPNCSQIRLKLESLMHWRLVHQACDRFYFILGKHLNLSQKTDFLLHFDRFFVYALLRPMIYVLVFCQMKGLINIHNHGKCNHYTICRCQVTNFQMQQQKVRFFSFFWVVF